MAYQFPFLLLPEYHSFWRAIVLGLFTGTVMVWVSVSGSTAAFGKHIADEIEKWDKVMFAAVKAE